MIPHLSHFVCMENISFRNSWLFSCEELTKIKFGFCFNFSDLPNDNFGTQALIIHIMELRKSVGIVHWDATDHRRVPPHPQQFYGGSIAPGSIFKSCLFGKDACLKGNDFWESTATRRRLSSGRPTRHHNSYGQLLRIKCQGSSMRQRWTSHSL